MIPRKLAKHRTIVKLTLADGFYRTDAYVDPRERTVDVNPASPNTASAIVERAA